MRVLRLVAQQGWRRLSMAAIAAEAGLPILTLYRTFPSKPAILCAFFRRIDETVLAGADRTRTQRAPARSHVRSVNAAFRRTPAVSRDALEVLGRELPMDPTPAWRRAPACCARSLGCWRQPVSRPTGSAGPWPGSSRRRRIWRRCGCGCTTIRRILAPTMAALDRRLRGIERWLGRGRRPRRDAAPVAG